MSRKSRTPRGWRGLGEFKKLLDDKELDIHLKNDYRDQENQII